MSQSKTTPEPDDSNAAKPDNEAERQTQGQKAGDAGAPTAPSVGQTQRQTAADDSGMDNSGS